MNNYNHIKGEVSLLTHANIIFGLTHLPLDKMAAISQTIFHMHFCE